MYTDKLSKYFWLVIWKIVLIKTKLKFQNILFSVCFVNYFKPLITINIILTVQKNSLKMAPVALTRVGLIFRISRSKHFKTLYWFFVFALFCSRPGTLRIFSAEGHFLPRPPLYITHRRRQEEVLNSPSSVFVYYHNNR